MSLSSTEIIGNDEITSRDIKNLLTIANLAKKSNLAKSKKSNLAKSKNSNFIKVNFSETDFLISKTKKTFTYLQKAFTKTTILYHFEPKRHIFIKMDVLAFVIAEVFSQIISDQSFSNPLINKNLNFFKSKMDQ